ncbi:hypothetical protein ACFQO7_23945 [Catellatospora aurea]|uniref:MFS transporter n=1 Tax=Catellatospora aurea TaxID=1337874 RepID=A0ABW2H4L9_9ACTN
MDSLTTDRRSAETTDQLAARSSALRLTWASPLYRGAAVAMLLSGLGFSAAAPQIASLLVHDLGGSLTAAGLFYCSRVGKCR